MGLRINQNIAAMNAYRNLTVTDGQMAKSLEKLSSGFRINRAADDAAGLSISEGLRAQVGGTKVAIRNAQDGISVVQTAEGALSETHSILQRMRDLAVQASNTGSQDANAVAAAQTELDGLVEELDRISATTSFGSTKLLDGTFGAQASSSGFQTAANRTSIDALAAGAGEFSVTIAGGASALIDLGGVNLNATTAATYEADVATRVRNALTTAGYTTDQVNSFKVSVTDSDGDGVFTTKFSSNQTFTLVDTDAGTLALIGQTAGAKAVSSTGGVFHVGANTDAADEINVAISDTDATALGVGSIDLSADATGAIDDIDDAITEISTLRGDLGAVQNRFEHTIANLSVAAENLSASESRIRDTDMAQEMVSFTRSQILTQAGTAMLAQANQAPQQVLQLLRG